MTAFIKCPKCLTEAKEDKYDQKLNEAAVLVCPNCGAEFGLVATLKRLPGEGELDGEQPPAGGGLDDMDLGVGDEMAPEGEDEELGDLEGDLGDLEGDFDVDDEDMGIEPDDDEDDEGDDEGDDDDDDADKKKKKKESAARRRKIVEALGSKSNVRDTAKKIVEQFTPAKTRRS